jgi:hypothetical protein
MKIVDTFRSRMSRGSVQSLSTNNRRRRIWRRPSDLFNVPRNKWNGLVIDQLWFGVLVNRCSMTPVRYRDDII